MKTVRWPYQLRRHDRSCVSHESRSGCRAWLIKHSRDLVPESSQCSHWSLAVSRGIARVLPFRHGPTCLHLSEMKRPKPHRPDTRHQWPQATNRQQQRNTPPYNPNQGGEAGGGSVLHQPRHCRHLRPEWFRCDPKPERAEKHKHTPCLRPNVSDEQTSRKLATQTTGHAFSATSLRIASLCKRTQSHGGGRSGNRRRLPITL